MSYHPGVGKRAIPRLRSNRSASSQSTLSLARGRVSRACLTCRSRKVKCSGEQPECQACRTQGIVCEYVAGRRDRLKSLTNSSRRLAQLLRELQAQAADEDKTRIEQALNDVADDLRTDDGESVAEGEHQATGRGEADVSAEVGSNEDVDAVVEDFFTNANARAAGYLGQASDVQVLRRLYQHSRQPRASGPFGPPGRSDQAAAQRAEASKDRKANDEEWRPTNEYNFYMDDQNLDLDMDIDVDPWELPPYHVARQLVDAYMATVQDSFPLLDRADIEHHLKQHYEVADEGQPSEPSMRRTQGLLNLVFVIGAVYAHLQNLPWQGDARDHLLYHARALRLLIFSDPPFPAPPDLFRVQSAAVLSMYYMAIGHVNRSWFMSGVAVRTGFALGMHVRNEDPKISASVKEARTRAWWGLLCLETTLAAATGRPCGTPARHCSAPYPLPIGTDEINDEVIRSRFGNYEQTYSLRANSPPGPRSGSFPGVLQPGSSAEAMEPPNSGSYLKNLAKVNQITASALDDLYSAAVVTGSWETIQVHMKKLDARLDTWLSTLPPDLRFLNVPVLKTQYQVTLALYYFSTRILVTRPTLCHINNRIAHQTQRSDAYNMKLAADCVRSAQAIASLLPQSSNEEELTSYDLAPWWIMVHFIMQALTTLLMNINNAGVDFPDDNTNMPALRKLIRALRVMSYNNHSANRAYERIHQLLKMLASKVNLDISDLISEYTLHKLAASAPFDPDLRDIDFSQTPESLPGPVSGADIANVFDDPNQLTWLMTEMPANNDYSLFPELATNWSAQWPDAPPGTY